MPTWNPDQYLRFSDERTRPCRDLAARSGVAIGRSPSTVIDLGCGPGNSTAVLRELWPDAHFTALDSSLDMIQSARVAMPDIDWLTGDISTWAADTHGPKYDVIFSNAALQWVGDHPTLYPNLLRRVGGILAIQVPINQDAPAHRIMRELARGVTWRDRFPSSGVREWHVLKPAEYYDLIAPHCAHLEIWETRYLHALPSVEAIVAWYQGSGLRPYLDALVSESDRAAFIADFRAAIVPEYPARPSGTILFPFDRLFLIATPGQI